MFHIPFRFYLSRLFLVYLVGLSAMTLSVLRGAEKQSMVNELQVKVMELVSRGEDQRLHLVSTAFAPIPDDPEQIVIEMSERDVDTQTLIPADDLAAMKEVKSTTGQYFFRVDRGGIYEVALVANFPSSGTWDLNYQFDNDVPRRTICKVEPGQENALYVFPVPEMRKGWTGGIHRLEVSIPGAGKIYAMLLRRGKPFDVRGIKTPPAANRFRPEKGVVRFAPVRPIGAEVIEGIRSPGSEGHIEWEVLNDKGQARPIGKIENVRMEDVDPLLLQATLYRDPSGDSAVLRSPQVLYQVDPDAVVRLANEHLSIEVDRRSGCIGRLIHLPTGRIFRQQADLPFRLMVWDGKEHALVPLDPRRFVCRAVKKENDQLTVVYEDTGVEGGRRTVSFHMHLKGEQLLCAMEVDNQTDECVRVVRFPYMSGVASSGDGRNDVIAWAGHYLGPVVQMPGYLKDYHTPMVMFASISDGSVGFYIGAHDVTGEADRMVMFPLAGSPPYDYAIEVDHAIEPGDHWSSQTHVVALLGGDWHAAADLYRKWYASIPRHTSDPDWLRKEYPGALNVYISPKEPFSSIVDWWKQARWRGSFFLKLNGVGGDGFSNNFYPYPSPLSGGPEHLRRAIEWVNKQGGQADAYLNVRYYSPGWGEESTLIGWTPRWLFPEDKKQTQLHDRDWTMRNAVHTLDGKVSDGVVDGSPHRPFQLMWNMSFRSKAWYDHWQYWIPYYAGLGLNIYWDQAMVSSYRCDLPKELRLHPDINYRQGLLETTRDAVEKARKLKPDFVLRGEGLDDRMMRYLHQNWIFIPHMINPVYRYTHPDQVLDQTVYTGDYQTQCEEGFLYHMRITGGVPWGKGWGMDMRDLTQLRMATHDVAFLGRYMDHVGLRGETDLQRARYVVLDEPQRQAVAINTVNRSEKNDDWVLELDWPFTLPPRSAFVYTLFNKVRRLPFTFEEGVLRFTAPKERLSTIGVFAKEEPDRPLRVHAYMPMGIPGKDIVRVSLANASDGDIKGQVRLSKHAILHSEKENYPFTLQAGEAKFLDMVIEGVSDLQDFVELPIEVDFGKGGRTTAIAQVAPSLPNGKIELDELEDSVPDYWRTGVRVAREDEPGYCLAVAAPGDFSIRDFVQVPAHLRPDSRYRLSFYARANNNKAQADIFERDVRSKNLGSHSIRIPESEEWRKVQLEFETGSDTDAGFSFLTFRCLSSDRRHAAWVDDVRLELLGPAER